MSSKFTLGRLPEESLNLFQEYAKSFAETGKGRKELLNAALHFSARLLYQKSKLSVVREWVELLEKMLSYEPGCIVVNASEPGIDWNMLESGLTILLIQMRGYVSYLEGYSVERLLECVIHSNLMRLLWQKKRLTLTELSAEIGFNQRDTIGSLNNLLDVRLVLYSDRNTFCLSADGERVAKVL